MESCIKALMWAGVAASFSQYSRANGRCAPANSALVNNTTRQKHKSRKLLFKLKHCMDIDRDVCSQLCYNNPRNLNVMISKRNHET